MKKKRRLNTHPDAARDPGTGHVEPLPDGRFKLRVHIGYRGGYRFTYNETHSGPKKASEQRARELLRLRHEFRKQPPREVKAILKASRTIEVDELRRRAKAEIALDPDDIKFGVLLDEWLESKEGRIEDSSLRTYKQQSKRLLESLRKERISRLDEAFVEKFYTRLAAEGHGTQSVCFAHMMLVQTFKLALKAGRIAKNPMTDVGFPSKVRHGAQRALIEQRKTEAKSFTSAQIEMFLANVKDQRYYVQFALAFALGCRPGELAALKWSDILPHAKPGWRTLHIQRSLAKDVEGNLYLKDTKSAKGNRKLPLPPALVELLEQQRRYQAEQRKAAGKGWHDNGLIFTRDNGLPPSHNSVWTAWKRTSERAGLPSHYSPKHGRHSAATLALKNGANIREVADRLGHQDIATTLSHYTDALPGAQEDISEKLVHFIKVNHEMNQSEPLQATPRVAKSSRSGSGNGTSGSNTSVSKPKSRGMRGRKKPV